MEQAALSSLLVLVFLIRLFLQVIQVLQVGLCKSIWEGREKNEKGERRRAEMEWREEGRSCERTISLFLSSLTRDELQIDLRLFLSFLILPSSFLVLLPFFLDFLSFSLSPSIRALFFLLSLQEKKKRRVGSSALSSLLQSCSAFSHSLVLSCCCLLSLSLSDKSFFSLFYLRLSQRSVSVSVCQAQKKEKVLTLREKQVK